MEQLERSWQQICAMKKEDYNLIDIRDELSFSYGNIPGSINITEEMLLADAEKWREKTVVLCCKKRRKQSCSCNTFARSRMGCIQFAGRISRMADAKDAGRGASTRNHNV